VAACAGISKPYLSNIETGKARNPPTDRVLRALEKALSFEPGLLTKLAHMDRTPPDVRAEHEMLKAKMKELRAKVKEKARTLGSDSNGRANLDALMDELGIDSNLQGVTAGVAVPVINKVAAGYPHHFTDLDYPPSVADDYIRCPDLHDPQAFAARVVGDSMLPAYKEGDIVVFSPNSPARNGDDCFVRFAEDNSTTFKRFYADDKETVRLQPLNSKYPAETYRREAINGLWPVVFRIERLR